MVVFSLFMADFTTWVFICYPTKVYVYGQTRYSCNMTDQNKIEATELTNFQISILRILEDNSTHGLGIKAELEEIYADVINHGRLYPNLDTLDEMGLLNRHAKKVDDRTNEYVLTDDGHEVLEEYREWLSTEEEPATAGVAA